MGNSNEIAKVDREKKENDINLEKALNEQLNKNGYSFQYAVLKEVQRFIKGNDSHWLFEVAEFPVSINGSNTHIDFILQNKHAPFYLICECKRVDPAISNWIFIKAPNISKNVSSDNDQFVREIVNDLGESTLLQRLHNYQDKYRLSFEIKGGKKGDSGEGRGQINNSITQVLRGFNGFIEYILKRIKTAGFVSYRSDKKIAFLPVIFTTAKIMTSEIDISESNLLTGNIDLCKIKLVEKEWCLYQYNQSPDLKHNFYTKSGLTELSDILAHEFTRTIPIVSAKGIRNFLSSSIWDETFSRWENL